MLGYLRLLAILALVISSEAIPRKYRAIPRKPKAEEKGARLPGDVIPSNYKVSLKLSEDDLKAGKFSGSVDITIVVNKDVTSFPIHMKNIDIVGDIQINSVGEDSVAICKKVTHDAKPDENDFLVITCDTTLTAKTVASLVIAYTGTLSKTEMTGFYQSTYLDSDGKTTKYLATTQFEETGARRAFPCFDEPAIKATFEVDITYPGTYKAISNTQQAAPPSTPDKDGLSTVAFIQTPVMSTYLVAFIVSEFTCTNKDIGDFPNEVCARKGIESTTSEALATAPASIDAMESYTGIDYKKMELGKLSQAAIPDFGAGAMENWGMLTYREVDLLWDKEKSSNYFHQGVVTVVTHELSHQWFGDFITLDWWSDIFLNEGFATYFEYHASDIVQPTWELLKQFVIEQVQPVLLTDSTGDTYPLSYQTNDLDVIESRFDDISYNKGGTILRMVHHFLKIDNFKNGLNAYLHKGPIGVVKNLWDSFQEVLPKDVTLPATVGEIMENWVTKPGYPVLNVTLSDDGKSVKISQEQFLLTGSNITQWYVPITYTLSNKTDDFTNTETKIWLKPDGVAVTIDLTGADWIILNNQQVGYYRVNYDDKLLDKISTVLKNSPQIIGDIAKSQLVDDQLNLARAGKKSYADVLKFLGFLKKETSYYPWYSALNGLNSLLLRSSASDIQKALKAFIKELIGGFVDIFPIDKINSDGHINTLSAVLALKWACNVEYGTCVKDTTALFNDYVNNKKEPNANLKNVVFCNGLRQTKDASHDYEILFNIYNTSNLATDRLELLRTLGCVNDAKIRQQYLKTAITPDVRIQDYSYVFSSVYTNNNPDGVKDVLTFINDNWKDFNTHFDDETHLSSLIGNVASYITNDDQLKQLDDLGKVGFSETIKGQVTAAVASANTTLVSIKALENNLRAYFNLVNNGAMANTFPLINLALILAAYLIFNYN